MRWLVENIDSNNFSIERIAKERMSGFETVEDFFNPSLDLLHDPYMMEDMEKTVNKIFQAIGNNEKILIYGDYDVDGISSTSILLKVFKMLGYDNISYYIPRRLDEGYGLNQKASEKIILDKVNLVITVDCGITSIEDVKFLKEHGVDVIVTDHHQCMDKLPDAYSILNPKKPTCTYPNSNLCGAGIAFKLGSALLSKKRLSISRELIEIAAVATVADIVELEGENRTIVKNGLKSLENPANIGLKSLINVAGLNPEKLTSSSISFGIAPRINSTGRLNNPNKAVELYMEDDIDKANEIARDVNAMNVKRQSIENEIFQKSLDQIKITKETAFIIVSGHGLNSGVIGIVSSKLTSMYNLPSAVIAIEGGIGHASCRSIEGLNVFELLAKTEDYLEKFGGHEQAAGFTIKEENIEEFSKKINFLTKLEMEKSDYSKTELASSIINIDDINLKNYDRIVDMEPFGQANKNLSFIVRNVEIKNSRPIGKTKAHFKAEMKSIENFNDIEMISFNNYEKFSKLDYRNKCDVLFNIDENNYRERTAQMRIIDIKKSFDERILYKNVFLSLNNLCENYEEEMRELIKDFTNIKPDKILKFKKDSIFYCYDFESYKNINIILDYAGIIPNKDNVDAVFMPVSKDIDLSKYKNIVIINKINKASPIINNLDINKYIMEFTDNKIDFLNIKSLEKYYIFLRKMQNKRINVDIVRKEIDMDIDKIFLYSFIFGKMGFIDTSFDFKYNNLIIGKIKSIEKKVLKEFPLVKKLINYFDLY